MSFLYKQESVSYEDLLVATRVAETEWTENKSIPIRLRSTTLKEEVGLKGLKKEVEALTAALKLTAFWGAKPKKGNASQSKQAQKKKSQEKTKTKGPQLQQLVHSHPYKSFNVEGEVMVGGIALLRET